jgi:hypothetical protein
MPTQRLTATAEYCTTVLLIFDESDVELVLSVELERPCLPARTFVLIFMAVPFCGLSAGEMPAKGGGLSMCRRPGTCIVDRMNALADHVEAEAEHRFDIRGQVAQRCRAGRCLHRLVHRRSSVFPIFALASIVCGLDGCILLTARNLQIVRSSRFAGDDRLIVPGL